jgi:hypothetical protein
MVQSEVSADCTDAWLTEPFMNATVLDQLPNVIEGLDLTVPDRISCYAPVIY